jgi:hypothetical protein
VTFYGTLRDFVVPEVGSIALPRTVDLKLRMIYTYVDGSTIQREFDLERNGDLVRTSGSTCKRRSRTET